MQLIQKQVCQQKRFKSCLDTKDHGDSVEVNLGASGKFDLRARQTVSKMIHPQK